MGILLKDLSGNRIRATFAVDLSDRRARILMRGFVDRLFRKQIDRMIRHWPARSSVEFSKTSDVIETSELALIHLFVDESHQLVTEFGTSLLQFGRHLG